jgi:hypothetical protein
MTRTSTFAVVTLAAIAATSLSTAAFAHGGGGFSGGGFGGGGFGGGHSSFGGPISATGGFAHAPVAASGIARSTPIARIPVGSSIQRSSIIARKPVVVPTGTGGAANSNGHSKIPTTTVISQLPKAPTPPNPIQDPPHNNPGTGPNFGPGVGPVAVPVDVPADTPVVVAGGEVAASATGVDTQPAAAVQAVQPTCTCLTKRYLDDGSVLFQDICSKEAALATPAQLKLQALKLNR